MTLAAGATPSPITEIEAAPSVATPVRLRRVGTVAELEAMRPVWDSLLDASPRPYVLLDHRWVSAWWRAFGSGKELHILVVEKEGRPIGLGPTILSEGLEVWPMRDGRLQIAEDSRNLRLPRWRRVVPIRRVSFPLNVASHNARAHALAAEAHASAVCDAAIDYWASRRDEWDMIALEGLPCDSAQRVAFKEAARRHDLPSPPHGGVRHIFIADLSEGFEGFLARRSRHFRKRRKEEIRACEKAGRLEIAACRRGDVARGLEIMFALERRTWKSRPDPAAPVDMALDDRIRSFFADVATAFACSDDAAIYVMSLDGEPVGALMALARGKTMLSLVVYLADEHRGRLNTTPLWSALFEDASARGMTTIDIHGVSETWRRWSTHGDDFQRLYIFNRSLKGRLLYGTKATATTLSRRVESWRRTEMGQGHGRTERDPSN